jgi:hypothetical protein
MNAREKLNFAYVNGALVQTVAGIQQTLAPALNFNIGSRSPPGADEFFMGGLAGISVYDTALTAAQIRAQYNAATAVPEPSSLVLTGLAAVVGAGRALWQRRRKASSSVSDMSPPTSRPLLCQPRQRLAVVGSARGSGIMPGRKSNRV